MFSSFFVQTVAGAGLCLVQFLAALPWLAALDLASFKALLRRPSSWGIALAGLLGGGIALGMYLAMVQDPDRLELPGRFYGALLHVQLIADLFVVVFALLLLIWPRGAAVALAAFREGVRQPMYWMLLGAAVLLLIVSMVIPYFTFGDDYKMMKQLGFDIVMLFAALFAVLAAAMSISEEIEGRTAVTLMSKPVSRREFLLGKFYGILLAAFLMTLSLGWCLIWALSLKPYFDKFDERSEPLQEQILPHISAALKTLSPTDEAAGFLQGTSIWLADALAGLPGLMIGFCQAMVLLAIAAALATRLPMVVNMVTCLLLFFLGHLAPILVQVSNNLQKQYQTQAGASSATLDLVQFMARLFDTFLPALGFFNLGPAIIRDTPLDFGPFVIYVGSVFLYAVLYSAIALLGGLILFEDRDLA